MPRIRTIKPEISFHEALFDLEQETGLPIRFVWSVFPCHCDREGRFEWRVRALGAQMLPYDNIDFSRVIDALWTRGFLEKYAENGREYGVISSFLEHQVINNKEKASVLPEPNENNILTREDREIDARVTREARVPQGKEGKGKERKGTSNTSVWCSEQREKISVLYNELTNGKKPKFSKWSQSRIDHLKARCKDKERDLDWWLELIQDIPNHQAAMDGDWFGLDWLLKSEDNLIKFCEGKYKQSFKRGNSNEQKNGGADQFTGHSGFQNIDYGQGVRSDGTF